MTHSSRRKITPITRDLLTEISLTADRSSMRLIVSLIRQCLAVRSSGTPLNLTVQNAEKIGSEWIARLNADDVSQQDIDRFEEWRLSHPTNARAYEEINSTWSRYTKRNCLS